MIEASRIGERNSGRKFIIVQGNYNPERTYNAVLFHAHFMGDVSSTIPAMVHASVEAGFDVITATDHDSVRAHDNIRRVIDRYGYEIKLLPGIEVTAKNANNQPRHCVYVAKNIDRSPGRPGALSIQEANEWAENFSTLEHPVLKVAAHPELASISVTKPELEVVQSDQNVKRRFNAGEITNGHALRWTEWVKRNPVKAKLLKRAFPDIPGTDVHEQMEGVMNEFPNLPVVGGSDVHDIHGIKVIVNLVPEEKDVVDAILCGDIVVLQQRVIAPIPTWRLVVENGLGELRGNGASKLSQ